MNIKSFLRKIIFKTKAGASIYAKLFRLKSLLCSGVSWYLSDGEQTVLSGEISNFYVDLTEIALTGGESSGVHRVIRNLFLEWFDSPPIGFRTVPIAEDGRCYRLLDIDRIADKVKRSEPIAMTGSVYPNAGDVFVSAAIIGLNIFRQKKLFSAWRTRGVKIYGTLHDLNPFRLPEHFYPDGTTDKYTPHIIYSAAIRSMDGIIAISRFSADDLVSLIKEANISPHNFRIGVAHNGCSLPQMPSADRVLREDQFLVVGQILKHKGLKDIIRAFELLWEKGLNYKLIIIGKTIPQADSEALGHYMLAHPEHGGKLVWRNDASDQDLALAYSNSKALIFGSFAEGFGLPMIEAAQYGLPVIARDLAIFHEIAGEHAFYFKDSRDSHDIADAIEKWMELDKLGAVPQSAGMPFLTWRESAERWKDVIFGSDWYKTFV